MTTLYSQALAYWYGEEPSVIIVSQDQLSNVKLKSVSLRDQAPPGPARFLPDSLTGKKLNNETVPQSSILITQKQLDKVKLKKVVTKPKPKFFILEHPVLSEVKAAGLIRCYNKYKRSSSVTICESIESYFKDRGFVSDLEEKIDDDDTSDYVEDVDEKDEYVYPINFERSCPIEIRKRLDNAYDDWSFSSDEDVEEDSNIIFPALLNVQTGETTEEYDSDSSYWDASDSEDSDECVTPKQELASEYDDIPSPILSLTESNEKDQCVQNTKQHMNIQSVKKKRKY